MAKRTDEATKDAIRKDAAAGMSVNAIATKHSVSWITAKTIIGVSGGKATPQAKKERRGKFISQLRGRRGTAPVLAGGVTLTATPELCDGIWATLPLEKKAALLNRLAEVN